MSAVSTGRRISLACALIALLAGMLAIWATNTSWPDASALVGISRAEPLATLAVEADPNFTLVDYQQHYDGSYYYAIASDPFALGRAHELIDQSLYRYGRPMHGWMAALLSFGQASLIPEALLLLSLGGLALAAYLASRLSVQLGHTPWAGVVIAMMPGLLFATTVSTTEPMGIALAVGLILLWMRRGSPVFVALLSIVMCLQREQLVVVILGILLFEIVDHVRRRTRFDSATWWRVIALLIGPAILADWWLLLHQRFGAWPTQQETGNIDLPFRGWLEAFDYARWMQFTGNTSDQQIGSTAVSWMIAILVLLVTAVVVSRRVRTPLEGIVIMELVLLSLYSWRTLVYPHEAYRLPVVAILAALGALFLRPRKPAATSATLVAASD